MPSPQIAYDGSRLRLYTTIRLRWFAVAGQTVTILLTHYGFGFPVPLAASLAVILLSAGLNVVLSLTNPRSQLLLSRHALLLLGYDILQLAALLYLTGGLENPFAFLLVVPVAVSASTQRLSREWLEKTMMPAPAASSPALMADTMSSPGAICQRSHQHSTPRACSPVTSFSTAARS